MQSGYPLLVDHNGWGVANHIDHRVPNSSNLLRSIGNELSRTAQLKISPRETASRDSFLPSYYYDYPQNPSSPDDQTPDDGLTRHLSLRTKRKRSRPSTTFNHGSPLSSRVNFNQTDTHRLESSRDQVELRDLPNSFGHRQNFSDRNSTASPPKRSISSSPRRPNSSSPRVPRAYRKQMTRASLLDEEVVQGRSVGSLARTCEASNYMQDELHSSYSLTTMNPNQFGLCCSPPGYSSYHYSEERLRQEPEPGLMDCCDTKISCCCSCWNVWCPTGHVNSLCTSLICIGIIIFIVLSPLLHYIMPT